jgi:glycosyltransferase involved in cell wall biosynthesis
VGLSESNRLSERSSASLIETGGSALASPMVTIGMTIFNAEATLARAVRSALAQTWHPIEIVIVDDFSTDASLALLECLASAHPEIRVFRNAENLGVAATRNRIVAEARGEFVAFFDDDDESAPERVEAQIERLCDYERNFAAGSPVVCYAARSLVYPDGSVQTARTMGQAEGYVAPSGPAVAGRILVGTALTNGDGACPTCSQLARLSTYCALGGFDPAFRRSEDTEFNVRLAMAGGHFVGVTQPLVTQFMTKTSEKSIADEFHYAYMMLEKHRDLVELFGDYAFSRRWIGLKQLWLEGRLMDFIVSMMMLALCYPRNCAARLVRSAPNLALNRAFRRFHAATTD